MFPKTRYVKDVFTDIICDEPPVMPRR